MFGNSTSETDEFYDAIENDEIKPKIVIQSEFDTTKHEQIAKPRNLPGHDQPAIGRSSVVSTNSSLSCLSEDTLNSVSTISVTSGRDRDHLVDSKNSFQTSKASSVHPLAQLAPSFVDSIDSDMTLSTTTTQSSLGFPIERLNNDMDKLKRIRRLRVKAKHKTLAEFDPLYLIQELRGAPGPKEGSSRSENDPKDNPAIFAMRFSPDGYFLATGGADGIVRIWKLLVPDILSNMAEDPQYVPPKIAAIFGNEPVQILHGHSAEILDITWSKNNFLLSASMDKTVRLWHHSKSDCLGVFGHGDFVTSVAFHPRDDRLFVSGCMDCRIRLWSIPERIVRGWNELPSTNYVTAVAFTNDGKVILAGSSNGVCLLFEFEGFRYSTQIHVHSRRGKNKIGRKISGIQAMPGATSREEVILISTNDSRIRAYTLRDKSIVCKYRGHQNQSSQIRATFSDDAEYIASGSEDGNAYIWSVSGRFRRNRILGALRRDHNNSFERITVSPQVPVTVAMFAPISVRTKVQSCGLRPVPSGEYSKAGEHSEGQFIVTADLSGCIKVLERNSQLEKWFNSC